MHESIKSKPRPNWLIRVVLFTLVGFGMATYGLYDALYEYPRRGEKFARFAEWRYLDALNGDNNNTPIVASRASIDDPAARFEQLEPQVKNSSAGDLDAVRFQWLRALNVINKLDPVYTTFTPTPGDRNPATRFVELDQEFQGKNAPKPLAGHDIPSQWVIVAVFLPIGVYNLFLLVWVGLRQATWTPSEKKLALPGGVAFTPDQIAEFDHSRWHKFFVEVELTQDHPSHPGESVRIDLLRRSGVEDWYLEMFAERFPDEPLPGAASSEDLEKNEDASDEGATNDHDAPGHDDPSDPRE